MEVDQPNEPLAEPTEGNPSGSGNTFTGGSVPGGAVSSLSVLLHPLVILNVAEHWTRTKAQNGGVPKQVIGAIIGKQTGRCIEVINSFELKCVAENCLDRSYYDVKEGQFKQVFVDLDLIGWYCTGPEGPAVPPPEPAAYARIHKQVCEINESAILLRLDPQPAAHAQGCLPVGLYESVLDVRATAVEPVAQSATADEGARVAAAGEASGEGEVTVVGFVPVPYQIETEDGERVGLDHIARLGALDVVGEGANGAAAFGGGAASEGGAGPSAPGPSSAPPGGPSVVHRVPTSSRHLVTQYNAVSMLLGRVKLLKAYLEAVSKGEIPKNHEVLRQCYSLCHRLPVFTTSEFKKEFFEQANDVCLMAYLGVLTKGCSTTNQFVTKFGVTCDRSGMGKRMRVYM